MKRLLAFALLSVSPIHAAESSLNGMTAVTEKIVRNWESNDGKKLEAQLMEFSEKEIKVKNTKTFNIVKIPLDRLSAADRDFVMDMVKQNSLDYSLTHGKLASQITGVFTKNVSKEGLNYQLMGNPEWDGKQRYPLLIWLHGAGQSGNDNESQSAGSPRQLYSADAF